VHVVLINEPDCPKCNILLRLIQIDVIILIDGDRGEELNDRRQNRYQNQLVSKATNSDRNMTDRKAFFCESLHAWKSPGRVDILYMRGWQTSDSCQVSGATLCQTNGGRVVPVRSIISPARECILLTRRTHPGESKGPWVQRSVVDFFVSPHPAAHFLLEHFVVKIVPMMNIWSSAPSSCSSQSPASAESQCT
jgi:hypothetical protein